MAYLHITIPSQIPDGLTVRDATAEETRQAVVPGRGWIVDSTPNPGITGKDVRAWVEQVGGKFATNGDLAGADFG